MDWYEPEVRQLELATAKRSGPADPVVFYGSSTIRLWSTLAKDLCEPRALNLGFGGSTLAACLHFFDRLVPPAQPVSLVLYAGDNDLGDGASPQEVCRLFSLLLNNVNGALGAIPFAFISIKPSPARFGIIDRIRAANQMVAEVLKQRRDSLFIDVFDAMLDPDGRPRNSLFSPDGLHMNEAGYRLWTQLILPFRHQIFTTDSSSLKAGQLS